MADFPNLYIHAYNNPEDIRKFIRLRVREAIRERKLLWGRVSIELEDKIIRTLIHKSNAMFRLASLHIDSLYDTRRVKIEANVHHTLSQLPPGVCESYDARVLQILDATEPNSQLALRLLKWLPRACEAIDSKNFI